MYSLVSIHELSSQELQTLADTMVSEWKSLSPLENRLPFKSDIPSYLKTSYSLYFPYVIKDDANILGTFTLREKDLTRLGIETDDNAIWLMDLFVVKCYRQRGIGSWALDQALQISKNKGYKVMYLQTASPRGIKLFTSFGFWVDYVIGGTYDFPLTHIMKKQIS